jgi:uncharacterized protein (TIGR00297 family)
VTTLSPTHLAIAAGAAAAIAVLAGAARLLSFAGAAAAFVVGFCIFGFGGLGLAVPLLAFFLSSSLLSKLGRRRKAGQATLAEKGSTRDAGQVLANGGPAAALAVIHGLNLAFLPPRVAALTAIASLAAANADTWATEIGGWWRGRPILLSSFKRVEPGTSGAVSMAGLVAALAGAAFVAAAGWAAWPRGSTLYLWRLDAVEFLAIAWAGFVAAFADSILGASVQAQYKCLACGALTERQSHCGGPAPLARGLRWFNNDLVNLAATLLGALFAWLLLRYFGSPL